MIVSFPYLVLNVYNFLQMKNRTVKPWVYLAERIITIGGMVMLGLMAIPAGFFIVQLSPVFISFWGAIFLNLLSLVEYQDKVILFAYHFLIFLAVFSIEFFYFQFLGRYKKSIAQRVVKAFFTGVKRVGSFEFRHPLLRVFYSSAQTHLPSLAIIGAALS